MKQIQLEPYKPKHIETIRTMGAGFGDLYFHQDGDVRISYWKCKSIIGRLLFLFTGKIELKQIIPLNKKTIPQALCINNPESQNA